MNNNFDPNSTANGNPSDAYLRTGMNKTGTKREKYSGKNCKPQKDDWDEPDDSAAEDDEEDAKTEDLGEDKDPSFKSIANNKIKSQGAVSGSRTTGRSSSRSAH